MVEKIIDTRNVFLKPNTDAYTIKSKVTISTLGIKERTIFPAVSEALSKGIRTISWALRLETLNFKSIYISVDYWYFLYAYHSIFPVDLDTEEFLCSIHFVI